MDGEKAKDYLRKKLNAAYDAFLEKLPTNPDVKFDKDGWHFSRDEGEVLSPTQEEKLKALKHWMGSRIRMIKLPELLIQVNNDLNFTRYFLPPFEKDKAEEKDICAIKNPRESFYEMVEAGHERIDEIFGTEQADMYAADGKTARGELGV
jgi:hypothetical protein